MSERVVDDVRLVGHEHHHRTDAGTALLLDGALLIVGEELRDGRLPAIRIEANPGDALGAVRSDDLRKAVEILARQAIALLDDDRLDDAASLDGLAEHFELCQAGDVGDLAELEAE